MPPESLKVDSRSGPKHVLGPINVCLCVRGDNERTSRTISRLLVSRFVNVLVEQKVDDMRGIRRFSEKSSSSTCPSSMRFSA